MTDARTAVISVLVADDHAIVRKGLIELLSRHAGFGSFGEAATARETSARVQADAWDVILLDLAFPDGSGIDALREILSHRPDARVIILTMHPEDQLALRMLKAGAAGYLTKESAPEELGHPAGTPGGEVPESGHDAGARDRRRSGRRVPPP